MIPPSVGYYRAQDTYFRNPVNTAYRNLVSDVMGFGDTAFTRNANRTRLFNRTLVFNCFPLVTVRKTAWKTALREMEGFLAGYAKLPQFHESVQKWWERQADPKTGDMPYSYGHQFRHYDGGPHRSGFDQIEYLLNGAREHPFSTRN